MASVTTRKNGSRFITFTDGNRDPQTITLGKVALRYVESFSLKTFIDSYIIERSDVKPRTKLQFELVRAYLLEHFQPDIPLRSITAADAEAWRLHMVKKGRGTNTTRRAIGRARQFFAAAIRRGLVERNPFEGMASTVKGDEKRFHFVTRLDTEKIITACPDAQWRLIVALCRWGGLRCPSEVLALTWQDVNWEHSRIRVPSPRTEHYEGGGSRLIPMFPELRPHLLAAFEEAEPGTVYVITRYRGTNQNLRTQLERIVRKAGLEPWGKPFQNMRATRETELVETFPIQAACKWIGNSEAVAKEHYLQVTDEHFARAVEGEKAQRQAQRQPSEPPGNDRKHQGAAERETLAQPLVTSGLSASFPVLSEPCRILPTPPRGIEPLSSG